MRKLLPLMLALMMFAACQKQQPTKTETSAGPAWSGQMTLATVPSPPINDKDTTFRLHLTDASGKPVTGASVRASLVMPLMDMGKNEVTLADKGAGDYVGSGKFTMSGPWNVTVTATAAGKIGEQTFPIVVRAAQQP